MNSVTKIFTGVILDRLTEWIRQNDLLSEFQAGFRKGYSTADNIFTLTSIARTYLDNSKKLFVFFVDFKAAFDSIDRNALFYKLSNLGVSTKMLKVIQSLYEETMSAVWNGEEMSNWFRSKMGVKQGCLLSPLLFSIFLDDLVEFLPGGILFNGLNIKLLLYADDIVIIAETANMLQIMINRLQQYCHLWNLTVNTNKSKIMVFRNGTGRYAREEKWTWRNEEIEKVKEYKYLGVIITPQLSFRKHLQGKLKEAKTAINCNWRGILGKKKIVTSAKYKLFETAMRSVMCYAAQVWGVFQHEEVEKLLRYFIKTIFKLPENTPTYMIHLETGLPPLYIFTLRMHFAYIRKVMSLPSYRLPNIVVTYLRRRELQFFREWTRLGSEHNVPVMLENATTWENTFQMLLIRIQVSSLAKYTEKAHESATRNLYRVLQYDLGDKNYFHDRYSLDTISTIFKVRGELLHLNYMPYRADRDEECTLCNLRVREDVYHFLGICPILKTIRRNLLGKYILTTNEMETILNGQDWIILYKYTKAAWSYRQQILNEDF